MEKIDDMTWHLDENFPKDLPEEAAATHMSMFLGWVIDNHKQSDKLKDIIGDDLEKFRQREISLNFLTLNYCEKLYEEYLTVEAAQFTKKYYDDFYLKDYQTCLDEKGKSLFHMPATWEKYEQVKILIEQRYQDWKNKKPSLKKYMSKEKMLHFMRLLWEA